MRNILVMFFWVLVLTLGEEIGHSTVADADSRLWPVGDSRGWTFGVLGWPNYEPLKAGDVLWFKYPRGVHNVVQVHEPGQYSSCEVPDNATVWTSGNNRITLGRGMSFFICSFPGHCKQGLKIAVTAS